MWKLPALHEFPRDIFSNEDRRQGAVVLHVLCVFAFYMMSVAFGPVQGVTVVSGDWGNPSLISNTPYKSELLLVPKSYSSRIQNSLYPNQFGHWLLDVCSQIRVNIGS
ncbi:hypothetical protein STEG23_017273, partial [Scotinomys teguina]